MNTASAAASVSATKDDGVSAGVRQVPGGTITYTVTIANAGDASATNVLLADAPPANTALLPDSLKVTPIAADDSYSVVGNTQRIVEAPGVLANDFDPDGVSVKVKEASLTRISGTTAGSLVVNENGSFTYTPAVGASSGTERFSYIVTDADNQDSVSVGYIDFTISGRVWYVRNGGSGDGRSHAPLGTPESASTNATAATDTIYILYGTGVLNGAFTLVDGQALLGQGVALTRDLATNGTTTSSTLFPATSRPTIANAAGAAVTLGQNNTLRGFNVGDTAAGDIVDGNRSVGTLTISNVSLLGSGQAIDIDQGGNLDVVLDELVSTSGTNGIHLSASVEPLTGSFTVTTGAISGSAGAAFLIGDGSGGANTGGAVAISYGGMITSGAGRAVDIQDRVAGAASVVLSNTVTANGGGQMGIFLDGNTGGSVVFAGSITTTNSGISISNNSGLTLSFSGGSKVLTSGSNTAVWLTNNTGSTISFTGGGLVITTTTGVGFNTSGGGTITVTGTNNTIESTSAAALNVLNTTIGAGGMVFGRISAGNNTAAADPVNGIVLTNTGSSGGLTVTGSGNAGVGGDGSGGVIQNTTGRGILLTNTQSPSFTNMRIVNTRGSGIQGAQVTNFTFRHGKIDLSNDDTLGLTDEANISFNPSASMGLISGTENSLSGVIDISNNVLTNALFHGIDIFNYAGTISEATISGNTITSTTYLPTSQGSGIRLVAFGSASTTAHVTKGTIDGNTIAYFPSGGGIILQGGNANATGAAGVFGTAGSATEIISVTNNVIGGHSGGVAGTPMNTHAIQASVNGRGQGNFSISGNGTVANPITNIGGNVISCSALGLATVTASVSNNVIVGNHRTDFGGPLGISVGAGQVPGIGDTATLSVTISGNRISQTDSSGIRVNAAEGSATIIAKIVNNHVAAPVGTGAANGIRVDSGNPSSTNNTVYLEISGNTTAGEGGEPGIGLRKQGTISTTHAFAIRGMTVTNSPNVETYVNGLNPGSTGGTLLISASNGFTNWFGAPAYLPLLLAPGGVDKVVAVTEIKSESSPTPISVRIADESTSTFATTQPIGQMGAGVPGITQSQIGAAAAAALARWEGTGLTAAQIARLRALRLELTSLSDLRLGESAGLYLRIDRGGGGYGWFAEVAEGSDAQFANVASASRCYSDPRAAPAGHVDLLTAIMHEMGHALGLQDSYDAADRDNIMYGWLAKGERRLPVVGQAFGAIHSEDGGTHFLSTPPTISALPPGKSVTITFTVQINDPTAAALISSQGLVTADAGISVQTQNSEAGIVTGGATLTMVEQPPNTSTVTKSAEEDVEIAFTAADFDSGFSDPNGDTVQVLRIITLPTKGTLKISGSAVATVPKDIVRESIETLTYVSTSDYNGTDAFGWNGSDGHFGFAASAATTNLTVTAVNDTPTLDAIADPSPIAEDAGEQTVNLAGISAGPADESDQTLTITAQSSNPAIIPHPTVAHHGSAATGTLTYTPVSNASGTSTITVTVKDNGGTADGGIDSVSRTFTVVVDAVNDAPVAAIAAANYSATEQSAMSLKNSGISVSDVDGGTGSEVVTLSVSEGMLTVAAGSTGVAVSGSGTASVTLTGTVAQIDALLNTDGSSSISYVNNSDMPGAGAMLTLSINDGGNTGSGGALSGSDIATIDITPANDAPVLDGVSATASYTENTAAVALSSALTVSDVDNPSVAGATVTIRGGGFSGDTLAADVNGTLVVANYNPAMGVLTLGGIDSPANYQTVLRSVTYVTSSENPSHSGSSPTRTIDWIVNDGEPTDNLSTVKTTVVTITAMNDAPAISAPASLSGVPNAAVTVHGVALADVDGGAGSYIATFSVSGGTLAASASTGVSIGGTTTALTLTGALADLNSALAAGRLTFTSTNNDTLSVTLNDQGNTGSGGALTASASIAVRINQPPVITTSGGVSAFTEGANTASAPVAVDAALTVTDADSPTLGSSATVSITANHQSSEDILALINNPATMDDIAGVYDPATGVLALTSAGTPTAAKWQAALRAVTYTNSSDTPNTASRTLSFVVNDGHSNSVGAVKTVAVAAANDAPSSIALAPASVSQSAGLNAAVGALSATDVDDAAFTFALATGDGTNDADNGSFNISGTILRANDAGSLRGGTHAVRIQVTDGHAGTFVRDFVITVTDDIAPAAPSAPDLAAASDTGASDSDNLTADATPTFTGTAEAGSTVRLYEGASLLGAATTTGGSWMITSTALAGGEHDLTCTATDTEGNESVGSAALTITIDATAPAIVSHRRQAPATVHADGTAVTWRVAFDGPVTGVDATDFVATAPTGSAAAGVVASVTGVAGDEATLYDVVVNAVSGQGQLRLDLEATGAGIADVAGNPLADGEFTSGEFYLVGVTNVFDTVSLAAGTKRLVAGASHHKVAQKFTTDATAPLTLTTVVARLGVISGTPAPVVNVYTDHATPTGGTLVTTLTNPADLAANALNVWSSAQLLTASTTYWLVFEDASAAGSYEIAESAATVGGVGSWLATYAYSHGVDFAATGQSGTLQIAIGATSAPTITSALTASGGYRSAFSYTITATNGPTSFSATGLPPGLVLATDTGVISGAPAQAGTFNVSLTATNASGTGATSTLILTIATAPLTVTANDVTRVVGASNPALTVRYAGFLGGDTAASLTTAPTANTVADASSPVGAYPITASGGVSSNYRFTYVNGSLTVVMPEEKEPQSITFGSLADKLTTDPSFALNATATSGLTVRFAIVSGPATLSGRTVTLAGIPGSVTIRATQPGNSEYRSAPGVERSFSVIAAPPTIIPPLPSGGSATLSAGGAPGLTYQWQRNGADLRGATGSSLTLTNVQPSAAGLYTYTATTSGGTGGTSEPVIVGLSTTAKVTGTGEQVGADIRHPNGNIYDQVLLEGKGATLTADATQITRISFVDLSNDIVQVEFSGAGSLSLVMDDASTPALASNYVQPGVNYVKGHVGIVITGANETSNVSVFSVGRMTAVDPSLFREDVAYDGVADLAFIAIQSANGKFGGVRTGNAEYFASRGFTGLYAPGVQFVGPVNIGDIHAFDAATPLLIVGSAADVRIAGGNLSQPNGRPVKVKGITQLTFGNGRNSHGVDLPAELNQAVLEQDGVDVTDLIVAGP